MRRQSIVIALLLLLILPLAAQAQTRYVSDELKITMRTGQGTQHKIIEMLKSGTPVEVLGQGDGYTRVRTPEGKTGWVLSRFLMNEPAARERIAANLERMQEMESRMESLQVKKDRLESLEAENKQLKTELAEIRELNANTVAIHERNEQLKQQYDAREGELRRLREANARLKDDAAQTWFVRGAGVVLLGILIGLIIPRIRWRRKRSWGDF